MPGGGGGGTVYQQPTQAELDAEKAANQQKAAALTKLNQGIYAQSKGLRGMGGLYDWAGPTPDLAPGMTAQNKYTKPQPQAGGAVQPEAGTGSMDTRQVGGGARGTDREVPISTISPIFQAQVRNKFFEMAGMTPPAAAQAPAGPAAPIGGDLAPGKVPNQFTGRLTLKPSLYRPLGRGQP